MCVRERERETSEEVTQCSNRHARVPPKYSRWIQRCIFIQTIVYTFHKNANIFHNEYIYIYVCVCVCVRVCVCVCVNRPLPKDEKCISFAL